MSQSLFYLCIRLVHALLEVLFEPKQLIDQYSVDLKVEGYVKLVAHDVEQVEN